MQLRYPLGQDFQNRGADGRNCRRLGDVRRPCLDAERMAARFLEALEQGGQAGASTYLSRCAEVKS